MVYWGIPATFLTWYIELYALTIPLVHYHKIAIAHYVLASLHVFGFVFPVLETVGNKFLQYGLRRSRTVMPAESDKLHGSLQSFKLSTQRLLSGPRKAHRALFARHGLFGVESSHFEVVFLVREVVETLLQTIQAYRMSVLLPRAVLNRSYVALLVLNCWTTPFLHYMVPNNVLLQRMLCILADILLDYASSVGVSTVLALSYVHSYRPDLLNFPGVYWYNDLWFPLASSFPALIGVKLYNSTVASWPLAAGFDKDRHPSARFFFGVRANFSNNTLPDGLMSPNFPPLLVDIELVYTNLAWLPDDLDACWPPGITLFLESGLFDHVPPVIYKLQPFMLVLSGNHLSAIPSELLMMPGLFTLVIRHMPISNLPNDGIDTTTMGLVWLYMDYTNITAFPEWMDGVFLEQRFVLAGASPACERLLADGAPADRPWLAAIDCVSFGADSTTYYPLEVDARADEDDTW
ncbi:hypothetical protein ATCC90586_003417 [Pythium insidiosum]|nr:hypothetical protein ATCC90586_003417 [Pythium insidiosum]